MVQFLSISEIDHYSCSTVMLKSRSCQTGVFIINTHEKITCFWIKSNLSCVKNYILSNKK
ncbi:hypothetical protein ROSINTL182_05323 [Roseburia intestinalis L1-82]|uniref:Uncharacterized protein n=1 Tax=Roseburia intestinalis L1-82 TaxID=536231 RepID=C7G613_9FIRM|nr:hypothetical protein ROSINTL182_05323 [Roseburia intestinalis L1-82]